MIQRIFVCSVIFLHFCGFSATIGDVGNDSANDVSILVMGLSGAGVFSTVEKLVKRPIEKTESWTPSVTEYSWPTGDDQIARNIRISWSPGLGNKKTVNQDARTVATVREYIRSPTGLNKQPPSVVIVVARFDEIIDARSESNSNFVRMLKIVETLKDLFSSENKLSNIIFHFTHVMGRGKNEAKQPNATIDEFKRIIRRNTNFPEPILTTVGENRANDYDLIRVGSYDVRLPNKQLYPTNLIDSIKEILFSRGNANATEIVTKAYHDHNPYYGDYSTLEIKTFSTENDTVEMESTTAHDNGNTLPTEKYADSLEEPELSEIDQQLQEAYNNLDEELKNSHPRMLQIVQIGFQLLNITSRDQLPNTTVRTVDLFQKLPFHMTSLALVQEAFNLRQPEFIHPPIVGQGYDVLRDETVPSSPFVMRTYKPTSLGYSFPDILTCKMEEAKPVENFKLLQSYSQYKESRLQDLGVHDFVNSSVFIGTVRSSYNNINPDSDAFVSLSAIQQIRNFKLDLIESSDLDEKFQTEVNNLSPFNQSDRESPKEWKSFFNKYGTHVVSEAYGGGYMEGKASGESVKSSLRLNNSILYRIKDNLLSFKTLPHGVTDKNIDRSHSFYGGSPEPQLAEVHKLSYSEREKLLRQWRNTVRSDPRILEMNLKLTPISTIARSVRDDIGHEVENALNHLLNGTLVYIRQKSPKNIPKGLPENGMNTTTTITTTENPFIYYQRNNTTTTIPPHCTNNSGNCPEPTQCPKCPKIPDPVCESCTCSSVATEKSLEDPCSKKQFTDFTENVIGQGYHILKDSVLQGSPFSLRIEKSQAVPVPHGVAVSEMESPCVYLRFKTIPIYSEYITERLNSIYTPNVTLSMALNNEPTKYVGSIRPGYNIMENLSASGPFSSYEELRYFEVKADLSKFYFNQKFEEDLAALPRYDCRDCILREKWLDFFNKYGTHIVTEGYAGTWQNSVMHGLDVKDIEQTVRLKNPNYKTGQCQPFNSYGKQTLKNAAVAIETAKLETLTQVLVRMNKLDNNVILGYDTAVIALLENRLTRC